MEIFTLTKFRYPKNIEDSFNDFCKYTFLYDYNKTYEMFFSENITEKIMFVDFNKIKNIYIKKICFILYVLYFKGGFFIDINVIPTNNIINFNLKNNSIYIVESILDSNNLFLGIFGSSKNNINLLNLIQHLINFDNCEKEFNSKIFYEIIKNNVIENVTILNEKIYNSNYVSTINEVGEVLFNHYYKPKFSYTEIPLKVKDIVSVKDIKVGITLSLFKDVLSFFSNGINQNSLFLCELLLNIGFDVYFIIEDSKLFDIDENNLSKILYDKRFKFAKYSEILYSEFNVIITLSFSYGEQFIHNYLKYLNTKHVGYFCGNTYIIESEKILYNQHKDTQNCEYDFLVNDKPKYDEIWSIPQMVEINRDFWSILYQCNCIEVPFVWSDKAIHLSCIVNKCNESDLLYKNRGLEKKIAVFEPNISIMKWALPSVLICENAYRNNKFIKHLYITNISSSKIIDFNLKQFNKFVSSLKLVKDKKCSIESRYNTLSFMKDYADVVLSHQWGNPLNYLYFDLAWMGWPILHNAYLCKNIGYFYDNFNLVDASIQLEKILVEHDKNIDLYIKTNREAIDIYLPTNLELQNKYKKLIFNLFS
uniref:Uncharacterized protein n=1 Tax=viral metagenome TaxID=1070528 RepID=A0A6C0JY18_9ZZZZ